MMGDLLDQLVSIHRPKPEFLVDLAQRVLGTREVQVVEDLVRLPPKQRSRIASQFAAEVGKENGGSRS